MRRDLLHFNQLEAFKAFLDKRGTRHRPPRGDFQVLQVEKHGNQWEALYKRLDAPEHFTVPKPLVGLVIEFIKTKKEARQHEKDIL